MNGRVPKFREMNHCRTITENILQPQSLPMVITAELGLEKENIFCANRGVNITV